MKKKASRRLTAAFAMAAMLVTLMPSGAAFAAPAEEDGEATKVEITQQRASSPVEYTIERHDDSFIENGVVKLSQYYDQVHVLGNSTAANKMNAVFEQAFKKYDIEAKDYLEAVQTPPLDTQAYNFQRCFEAKVTKNSEGQFSVKVSSDWFMGGVHNNGYEGFNFDSRTGEQLKLGDFFQMSQYEAETYIITYINKYIEEHPNLSWWDWQTRLSNLEKCNLLESEFYIDGDNLVLCFEEYILGSGALGAVMIPCPMPPTVTVTTDKNTVQNGETIQIVVKVTRGNKPADIGDVELYWVKDGWCGGKSLGRQTCNSSKEIVFSDIVVSKDAGWQIGEKNKIEAWYSVDRKVEATGSCVITVSEKKPTTPKVEQNQPPAPVKLTATDSSITLQDIEDSNQGVHVQYSMEKEGYGIICIQSSPIFEGLEPDKSYTFYAKYPGNDYCYESPISAGTTIRTEKAEKKPQDKPQQPNIDYVGTNEVQLQTVWNSYNTPVKYGIYEKGGVRWQDHPLFTNLQSDYDYKFCVKYLGDDQHLESVRSNPVVVRTEKKYFYSPKIISDDATVMIRQSQSSPREKVHIEITPNDGFEVDKVVLKDKKGNAIAVNKKSDTVYTFEQTEEGAASLEVYCRLIEENEWHNPFYDVYSGAWYYDAVRYVYENGLIAGVASDCFAPDMDTSRGQLVTMLWRMAGEPNYGTNSGFDDVSSSAYYARAVAWASAENIVAGFPDGSFRPNEYITREQMAAFFMKYAAATGAGTYQREDLSQYSDINPNSWSYDALSWAKAVGLLSGVSDTTMAPQATATRAQIAAVLQRYCETVAK